MNFDNFEKDYVAEDLIKFKNLKVITLTNFNITNDDIELLKNIVSLSFIHFDFCNFNCEKLNFNSNIQDVVINCCTNFKLSMLSKSEVKSLKIIGLKSKKDKQNLLDLEITNALNELSLNNYVVYNINKILSIAPNLIYLNLNGSTVNEDELKNIKIKISHDGNFIRANA